MRLFYSLWISLYIVTRLDITKCVYSAAKETEIRAETVKAASYDMISRPAAQTMIKLGISILAIEELDLKSQKLEAVGWLTLEWEDARLVWNHTAKDDIEYIFSKPADTWKPELVVNNSMEDLGVIVNNDLYLRIKYDGTVEWEPHKVYSMHCQMDMTYYPYDTRKCRINIVSWGYTAEEVMLEVLSDPINLRDFKHHGEWQITSSSYQTSNLTETLDDGTVRYFPQIEFWLHLERRSYRNDINSAFWAVLLTTFLVSLTFKVPVDCGEKLSYTVAVFLALTVLQTLVADSMPSTSMTRSVLGLYVSMVSLLSTFGVSLTVLILNMFYKTGSPKSSSIIMIITRLMTRCIHYPIRPNITWKQVAVIWDLFFFPVFMLTQCMMHLSFTIALFL